MRPQLSRRGESALAGLFIVALIVGYAALVPRRGELSHFDQTVYEHTVVKMHDGEGFYDAFEQASAESGVRIQHARGFRLPTAFIVWRAVPVDHLYVAYLVLVVGVGSLVALLLTETPLSVVAVTLYLLCAGRLPGTVTTAEEFLLLELWTVPLVFAGIVLWRQRRWWPAAFVVGFAVLTREVTAPLLLGGLLAAQRRGLPRRPWIVVGAVVCVLYALHLHLAGQHLVTHGNDAPLVGTERLPGTILDMMDWILPAPSVIGLGVWVLAVARAVQRREIDLLGPFLAIPLTGLFVSRPYWGLVFVPLCSLLATEFVVEYVKRWRTPAGAAAGSSRRRRTLRPGSGTQEVAPAPPFA